MKAAGEIDDITVKPKNVRLTAAKILYIPDFSIIDLKLKELVYVEAKGFETSDWRIKRRLWLHYGPGLLRIYKGTAKSLTLTEELRPKKFSMFE